MSFVLTVGSQITCAHQAPVSLSSNTKLSVMGARVLVVADVVGASIITCPNPDSSSSKKCTRVATAGGTATKLTASGQPVFNESVFGSSDGVTSGTPPPVPVTLISPGQAKLTAE